MQSADAVESVALMKPIEAIFSISKDTFLRWMPSNKPNEGDSSVLGYLVTSPLVKKVQFDLIRLSDNHNKNFKPRDLALKC